MKHPYLFASLCLALGMASCSGDNDSLKDVEAATTYGTYVGAYEAYLADGTLSKKGNAQTMRIIQAQASDTLYMDQISFTDKVPYAFDIRFTGVHLAADGKTLQLQPEASVPEMMAKGQWTNMPAYTISQFSGRFSADSLYLEFLCGENLLKYAGKFKK